MPAPQYMGQQPFFPHPHQGGHRGGRGGRRGSGRGVTLAVASSNNFLNDTYQTLLPSRNPGQRPITFRQSLKLSSQCAPPEGVKTLSVTTLQEREGTPCSQRVRTLCIQTPQEGVKTPCFHTPPEGKKTP